MQDQMKKPIATPTPTNAGQMTKKVIPDVPVDDAVASIDAALARDEAEEQARYEEQERQKLADYYYESIKAIGKSCGCW